MQKKKWCACLLIMLISFAGCMGCQLDASDNNAESVNESMKIHTAKAGLSETEKGKDSLSGTEKVRMTISEAEENFRATEAEQLVGDSRGGDVQWTDDSFKLVYNGQESNWVFLPENCQCEYEDEDMVIYSRYVSSFMLPDFFPCDQYVLFIRTPEEDVQIFPVKEFMINKEQGILYMEIWEAESFDSIQRRPFLGNGTKLMDAGWIEDMFAGSYGLEKGGEGKIFSDLRVELKETYVYNGEEIITGEASGIYTATGEKYYMDWTCNASTGIKSAEPCVLRIYDTGKDKEIFEECARAYDRIEQGEYDAIAAEDGMEYKWGAQEAELWLRMDVNGDGLPELLAIDGWHEDKNVVSMIITYQDGKPTLVYTDYNDGMEFLFAVDSGKLVYKWGISNGPPAVYFRECRFDVKWNRVFSDMLLVYYFTEETIEERGAAYYEEYYPDTYGMGGCGTYYLRIRSKTEEELQNNTDGTYSVREYLTQDMFFAAYKELTGCNYRGEEEIF